MTIAVVPSVAAADLLVRVDGSVLLQHADLAPDRWQRDVLIRRSHRLLVLTSRQVGKSTTVAARALHKALTVAGCTVVCIAPTERQSIEIITKVRRLVAAHPGLDRIPRNAATQIGLPNGSRIIALPGKPDTIRGYSAHLLILDEAAYLADEVFEAATPMAAAVDGDIIALTTPNGRSGWFYSAWTGDDTEWDRVTVRYDEVSRITDAFIRGERGRMSPARFSAEYECEFLSPAGAVWDAQMIARITTPSQNPTDWIDYDDWKRERDAA